MTVMSSLDTGFFPAFIPETLRPIGFDETFAGGRLGGVSAILGKLGPQIFYTPFKFGYMVDKVNEQKTS